MSEKEKSPSDPHKTGAGKENQSPGGVNVGNNIYVDPVYYYSRERRLSRASPAVQALNDGKPIRPGLSRSLFATRAHVLIFVTIVILCATLFMAPRISGREKGIKLGGNTVALAIFREPPPVEAPGQEAEGALVLGIIKSMPEGGEVYTGAVDIAVSPVMRKTKEGEAAGETSAGVPPVFTHRVFFAPSETETYYVALPFTEDDFVVLLRTESEQKSLRVKTTY